VDGKHKLRILLYFFFEDFNIGSLNGPRCLVVNAITGGDIVNGIIDDELLVLKVIECICEELRVFADRYPGELPIVDEIPEE
jgi:hypothetical protein